MVEPEAWVPLAEVARPHGVRGEIRLRLFNRDSQLLLTLEEVLLRFPEGDEQEVSVDSARRANDAILMKLFTVDDRDRAESLRGALVCVRRGDFPPLGEGEFYACDLEGAHVVVRQPGGARVDVGRVRELQTYPTVDVLVVDALDGGAPWEIPLVDAIVDRVDVAAGEVSLSTLEGVERA
jgi:16S rRNA processing protein RimM